MADDSSGDRSIVDRVRGAFSDVYDRLGATLSGCERTYPTPPRSITDDAGRAIELRAYEESAFEALVGMYADFDPAQRAQGTPPVGEQRVSEWLSGRCSPGRR